MRLALSTVMATFLVAAGLPAANIPTATVSDVTNLASLLEGEFTTAPDPSAGQVSPGAPAPLYFLAKRVEVPSLGHDVVYAEIREGAPHGQLLHQRLYALTPDKSGSRIMMAVYDIGPAPALAGAYADPAPLARLNPPDLKPEGKACEIAWHRADNGFAGQGGDGDCPGAIMSVSKKGMDEAADKKGGQPIHYRRLR